MDRRIKYTRMVLNESLIRFLEKKEIRKITVTEICKDAEVNRSTYYAHFSDPFDQLSKVKTELVKDMADFTRQIDSDQLDEIQRQHDVMTALMEYVGEKRNIFRIFLSKNADHNLQQEILSVLGDEIFSFDEQSGDDIRYRKTFVTNGCFGMFYQWLMSAEPISAKEIAGMMVEFTQKFLP